jgi:hypothetical protein
MYPVEGAPGLGRTIAVVRRAAEFGIRVAPPAEFGAVMTRVREARARLAGCFAAGSRGGVRLEECESE